ncbi:hypothetical protein Nepgr_011686 [Nepenthes gracilis]|uniref:Uncharacterized protein n=1 Tax=Nepenthes gracilis TaxID=150966 RepID=A0AAD3SEI7_NEPGR|nr:hypothetical protein Nepgr_011686 [Nepenthes gracilis]
MGGEPSALPAGVSSKPATEETNEQGCFGCGQLVEAEAANDKKMATPVEATHMGTPASMALEGLVAPPSPTTSEAPYTCHGVSTLDQRH